MDEMRKAPSRPSELTAEHYQALFESGQKDYYPKVLWHKTEAIGYRTPPYINRDLLEKKLIKEHPEIPGYFEQTELGKVVVDLFPTYQSLIRKAETKWAKMSFEDIGKLKVIKRD
ncbi:MAG: hypothetical protein KGH53_00560 [Candidatus Micrarchaeota archaeon]|nr:hypothetical protein [Candidatus Micrarchaeota archaeon]